MRKDSSSPNPPHSTSKLVSEVQCREEHQKASRSPCPGLGNTWGALSPAPLHSSPHPDWFGGDWSSGGKSHYSHWALVWGVGGDNFPTLVLALTLSASWAVGAAFKSQRQVMGGVSCTTLGLWRRAGNFQPRQSHRERFAVIRATAAQFTEHLPGGEGGAKHGMLGYWRAPQQL